MPKLNKRISSFSQIKDEQDSVYEQLVQGYQMARQVSLERRQNEHSLEEQLAQRKAAYLLRLPVEGEAIDFKMRMPVDGSSKTARFSPNDLVGALFEYVDCLCRDEFEDKWADFDLTQTFPYRSLLTERTRTLRQVFEDSQRENVIVKEI